MEHDTPCTEVQLTTQRVRSLEERADDQKITNDNLYTIIQEIRDKLLGRPSWSIVFVLTALSSLCVGLIVKMLT